MDQEVIFNIMKHGEKQNFEEMKTLIINTPQHVILEIIKSNIKTDIFPNFWNYLLKGFVLCSNIDECYQRWFECTELVLNELSKINMPYKKSSDLITRLCSELSFFKSHQLIAMVDICFNCIKFGDKNLLWWKDIVPELLSILTDFLDLDVNGTKISGLEYKDQMVKSIISLEFSLSNLTPFANMLIDLKLEESDLFFVLKKFCEYFPKLSPMEIPPLAYQLFHMCQTASQLIIPILGLEKYFNHFYYNKSFMDLNGDSSCFDSIETFSEKDIREAEETILHHLSYCVRFGISEEQIQAVFRNLIPSSEIILKPFVLSAIISMSLANRESNLFVLSSPLLLLLQSTIKKNEEQLDLFKVSIWYENSSQTSVPNMEKLFSLLIDKNKEGKDVITQGLVNLAFVLLRTKNCKRLNLLGTTFLVQFIKKRFVFSNGIVRNLTDWMMTEPDSVQYSECLAILSHTDAFTISESFKEIKNVLESFLWIPGKNAMTMMSFIFPVLKISQPIRDAFIEIMKEALYSNNKETCLLGVYGFCSLIKQLNNNNSQRSNIMGTCFMATQQCISGYSLLTQSNLSNRVNSQRNFDILVLEIIGCLRKCFVAPLEIKENLYENISRSVFLNFKLAPHFLLFIEYHFRSYFKIDESETIIYFDKVVSEAHDVIKISDNIGKLTILVSSLILICEKNDIVQNSTEMKTIINTIIERLNSKDFELVNSKKFTSTLEYHMAAQQLNFLESLMYFLLWTSKNTNDNIIKISTLFETHQKIMDNINSRENKLEKEKGDGEKSSSTVKNISKNKRMWKNGKIYKNIWDLPTFERFLKLLFDDVVPFANCNSATNLKNDVTFLTYILKTSAEFLKDLQSQPSYKQIKLSIRLFKQICAVTKIIYNQTIKNLPKLWKDFDSSSAYFAVECLKQSFLIIQNIYDKKFDQFLKEIDPLTLSEKKEEIYHVIQNVYEAVLKEEESCYEKIAELLLCCLDVLYNFIPAGTPLAFKTFDWLYDICQNHEISTEKSLIFKLLFTMRVKTNSGSFFETIAIHLGTTIGHISEIEFSVPQFDFKAITLASSISCYFSLINSLQQQLEITELFISKVKSSYYNIKFLFENDQDIYKTNLKTMERAICTQFTHIANSLIEITNINLPLDEKVDSSIRLLIQFYISVNSLTKYLMSRHSNIPVSFSSIKYEQVVRLAGKPLATNIYALILNIDEKIAYKIENNKKKNPEADGAKILRETKYFPKLILSIENFNKFVMFLSKKTGNDLTHLLHIGTVRDFRIQTKKLEKAIHESLLNNSEMEEQSLNNINNETLNIEQRKDNLENLSCDEESEKHEDNTSNKTKKKKKKQTTRKRKTLLPGKIQVSDANNLPIDNMYILDESNSDENDSTLLEETPIMGILNEEQDDENAGLQFLKNVAKVSEKSKRKKVK